MTSPTKTRILLADDEEGIRKVLGISLADSGYEVLYAENGLQALDVFRSASPAIVLSDIKMPGLDGIELLRRIKAESPDTEVIMITGHGDMALAIESLKLEATDFVTKPINDDVLEIALKRANERIRMRGQLQAYTENLEAMIREKSARLVALERTAAVGQAIEGLASAMSAIAGGADEALGLFNEMPCLVAVHNRDLHVVAANRLYRERLGERIGAPSWEIYHPLPPDPWQCPAAQTFRSGKGQRSRETLRYLNGELFPAMVYTAPITNREGEAELVLEIAADMGELRRLQEALRASQQRYRQLFDTVPCYITLQDRSRRIVDANRRFREDFGESPGAFCFKAYQGRDTPCENCPVVLTFSDGELHQTEMKIDAGSGKPTDLLVWTAPLRDEGGQITHVMELATDISPVRQLQDHLSSLGLMLGSISHGIKGVLTGLDAGLYMLASGLAHDGAPQVEEGLSIVRRMVERIRSVVLDILTYARERTLNWRELDVAEFAAEVAAVAEPRVKAHGVTFSLELSDNLGRFEADATMLRSALLNLLENAAEACTEERSGRAHRVICMVRREGEGIEFRIDDNGCGMSPEVRAKLFTLFFSSKGHAGTGLGLFIADRFIRQHGGTIEVQTSSGQGSIFTVRLPATLPAASKTPEALPQ